MFCGGVSPTRLKPPLGEWLPSVSSMPVCTGRTGGNHSGLTVLTQPRGQLSLKHLHKEQPPPSLLPSFQVSTSMSCSFLLATGAPLSCCPEQSASCQKPSSIAHHGQAPPVTEEDVTHLSLSPKSELELLPPTHVWVSGWPLDAQGTHHILQPMLVSHVSGKVEHSTASPGGSSWHMQPSVPLPYQPQVALIGIS